MKKAWLSCLTFIFLFICNSSVVYAEEFDFRGIKLGITEKEFLPLHNNFRVAGKQIIKNSRDVCFSGSGIQVPCYTIRESGGTDSYLDNIYTEFFFEQDLSNTYRLFKITRTENYFNMDSFRESAQKTLADLTARWGKGSRKEAKIHGRVVGVVYEWKNKTNDSSIQLVAIGGNEQSVTTIYKSNKIIKEINDARKMKIKQYNTPPI